MAFFFIPPTTNRKYFRKLRVLISSHLNVSPLFKRAISEWGNSEETVLFVASCVVMSSLKNSYSASMKKKIRKFFYSLTTTQIIFFFQQPDIRVKSIFALSPFSFLNPGTCLFSGREKFCSHKQRLGVFLSSTRGRQENWLSVALLFFSFFLFVL